MRGRDNPSHGGAFKAFAAPISIKTSPFYRWFWSHKKTIAGYLFILPAVLYLFVLIVYPIILTFQMSTNRLLPDLSMEWMGFENYIALFKDTEFFHSVKVTVLFVVMMVTLHLIVGVIIALLLSYRWPSLAVRNFVRGLLILPWLFSSAASAVMWSLLFHPFGTFNYMARAWFGIEAPIEWLSTIPLGIICVALVGLWKSYPFYMVIILGGLQTVPEELYDAAKVDGANSWQSFWRITMPLIRPVIVAVTVIDIIGTVAMYDLVRMLTDGGPRKLTQTVSYYLWKRTFLDGRIDYGSAISIVMLISLVVLIGLYLKLVAKGGISEGTAF